MSVLCPPPYPRPRRVQSIRKTYEQIVKRLKEERIGFDNQLAAIERTLKAKEKDLEELVLMSHDAQVSRAQKHSTQSKPRRPDRALRAICSTQRRSQRRSY